MCTHEDSVLVLLYFNETYNIDSSGTECCGSVLVIKSVPMFERKAVEKWPGTLQTVIRKASLG